MNKKLCTLAVCIIGTATPSLSNQHTGHGIADNKNIKILSVDVNKTEQISFFYDESFQVDDFTTYKNLSVITPSQDSHISVEELTINTEDDDLKIDIIGVKTGLKIDAPITGVNTVIDTRSDIRIEAKEIANVHTNSLAESLAHANIKKIRMKWVSRERHKNREPNACGKHFDVNFGLSIDSRGDYVEGSALALVSNALRADIKISSNEENIGTTRGIMTTRYVCPNKLTAINVGRLNLLNSMLPTSFITSEHIGENVSESIDTIIDGLLKSNELAEGDAVKVPLGDVPSDELTLSVLGSLM